MKWSVALADRLRAEPDFTIHTEPVLSLFTFLYTPPEKGENRVHEGGEFEHEEALNAQLVADLNNDGRIYVTQTRVDGRFVIRFTVGQFNVEEKDVMDAFDVITEIARGEAAT